jgi:hypothetical protein
VETEFIDNCSPDLCSAVNSIASPQKGRPEYLDFQNKNRIGGAIFVIVLTFSLLWSLITAGLSIFALLWTGTLERTMNVLKMKILY